MQFRFGLPALVFASCLGAMTTALAQQQLPTQQNPAVTGTLPSQRAGWQNGDQLLATCVVISNQKEVALAKFAEEKAKDDDVKEFAQMLAKDHQAFIQKLARFAPEATSDRFLQEASAQNRDSKDAAQSDVKQTVGTSPNAAGGIQRPAGTQSGGQQGIDPIQLDREIARECLASAKQKLGEDDGKHFDQCFVGMQIAGHMAMLDKLTVFERHASGELKQLFADGKETTQKHLDKAEKLMKELASADDKSSNSKSREKKD